LFPVRRLLSLALSEWRSLALGTLFLFIGTGVTLLYPQAIRRVLDGGGRALPPGLILGALAVHAVATSLRYVLFTTTGERIVARLRQKLFSHLLTQEIALFDERRTGELVSRLVADTSSVQNAVSVNISMAVRNLATVVGGLALLFYTSPRLTGFMLLIVPPVAVGAVFYARKLRRLSRDAQDALAESTAAAEETLGGIRTVRSFAAEDVEAGRYGSAIERAFGLSRRSVRYAGLFMGTASFAAMSSAALVLWRGSKMAREGAMTSGALGSFVIYTVMVAFSLGTVMDLWAEFNKARGAAERVFELLDRDARMRSGDARPAVVNGEIRFEGVRFAYPARPDMTVLEGLDLTLAPGKVVALVGPSGAGKSTIAALLARLYDPVAGRVLLDGRDLRELDPAWLRRQIGVVSQEPLLFSRSIAENIRYARPEATDAEVEAAARAANAHDFIKGFPEGYATRVGERGVQLSGGQRQRVAIARCSKIPRSSCSTRPPAPSTPRASTW
jgi:ATP-binding cassette subfamily B protein